MANHDLFISCLSKKKLQVPPETGHRNFKTEFYFRDKGWEKYGLPCSKKLKGKTCSMKYDPKKSLYIDEFQAMMIGNKCPSFQQLPKLPKRAIVQYSKKNWWEI